MIHVPFVQRRLLCIPLGLVTIGLSCLAFTQVFNKELQVRIHGLPKLMARSPDPSDVLLTSLHVVLRSQEICCTEESALGDRVRAADPNSLKDLAAKLTGRHVLSDGGAVTVTAEYLTVEQMNAGHLIKMISDQHPALLQWDSHIYVLDGLGYVWMPTGTADSISATSAIRKFLLLDTRYSDARRRVEFNRDRDDLSKIEGLLFIEAEMR